jgi:hypothetical protein
MPTPPHEAARRRRGRIQKAVVRALIAAGGRDVATTDIARWAYPCGRVVAMPTPCHRCGCTEASIGHGSGPHAASLLCVCSAHLGWLPQAAFNFIHETARHFGADAYEPIIIRGALQHAQEVKVMSEKKYDDTNRGALFRDDNKSKETDRDYSGTLNVGGALLTFAGL